MVVASEQRQTKIEDRVLVWFCCWCEKEKREKNKVDVAKQHKRSLHWQKVSYYI